MGRPKRTNSNPSSPDRNLRQRTVEIPSEVGETIFIVTQFTDDLNETPKSLGGPDDTLSSGQATSATNPTGSGFSQGSEAVVALKEEEMAMEAEMKKMQEAYAQKVLALKKTKRSHKGRREVRTKKKRRGRAKEKGEGREKEKRGGRSEKEERGGRKEETGRRIRRSKEKRRGEKEGQN